MAFGWKRHTYVNKDYNEQSLNELNQSCSIYQVRNSSFSDSFVVVRFHLVGKITVCSFLLLLLLLCRLLLPLVSFLKTTLENIENPSVTSYFHVVLLLLFLFVYSTEMFDVYYEFHLV